MGTGPWTKGSRESKNRGIAPVHQTAERLVVVPTRPPEPAMSLPRTVTEVIDNHVTLELESLDRVYLNVYQPQLQTARAVIPSTQTSNRYPTEVPLGMPVPEGHQNGVRSAAGQAQPSPSYPARSAPWPTASASASS